MVFSPQEIPAIAKEIGYPLVVKGKFYDAKIAYTDAQAMQHFNKISAEWGLPIIIQEFVHGSEVNVCGIGNGSGVTMGAVPMRKLYITDKGRLFARTARSVLCKVAFDEVLQHGASVLIRLP